MNKKWIIVGLVFAGLLGPSGARAVVLNGDFEAPPVTGSGGTGFDFRTGYGLTDWTIFAPNRGILQFDDSYRPVGGGFQSIQLEYADDYIEQLIPTVIGQNYLLSFIVSAWAPIGADSISTLEVEIGGGPSLVFAGTSATYAPFSISFTAGANSTLIHFENGGPAPFGTYPHLDNISVSAVPEPATYLLFVSGMVMVVALRKCTHRMT